MPRELLRQSHNDSLNCGNGTWSMCDVEKAEPTIINVCDGDGWTIENKDGTERTKRTVALIGHWLDTPAKEAP